MDIAILTLALGILGFSVNFFSGKYKLSLFSIIGGFVVLYIADLVFAYTTSLGIYYNGSPFEVLFNIALFLLIWGTLSFYITPKRTSRTTG